jgi:hypothetical protein
MCRRQALSAFTIALHMLIDNQTRILSGSRARLPGQVKARSMILKHSSKIAASKRCLRPRPERMMRAPESYEAADRRHADT